MVVDDVSHYLNLALAIVVFAIAAAVLLALMLVDWFFGRWRCI